MNTITRLFNKKSKKNKNNQRHCSIQESLTQSLKEIKLIKQGKLKAKTWDDLYGELKEDKEK